MKLDSLLHASPNSLVLLAVFGILLIYVELNRPGTVFFGAMGLLLLLLAVAGFGKLPWHWQGAVLLAASLSLQAFGLRTRLSWLGAVLAGLGTYGGCRTILSGPGQSRISIAAAVFAAAILGPGTSILTGIARRARRNKGLDSI